MSQQSDPNLNIDYRRTLNVARVHSANARENPDRVAESRPVSLWVALGAMAAVAFGGFHYGKTTGSDYNKDGLAYAPSVPHYEGPSGDTGPVDPIKAGQKVFANKCAQCHQGSGLGQPGLYPPLDGSEWVTKGSERLAMVVAYGLSGPVTVKGQLYPGSAIMPPHAPPVMSKKELAYVLSYVRNAWSNKASIVDETGIADLLERNKGRANPLTEADFKALPEDKDLPSAPAPAAAPAAAAPAPAK